MERSARLEAFLERTRPVMDLGRAAAVLGWDQNTYMPPGGAEARAEQTATLTGLVHERLVSDETVHALEALEEEVKGASPGSFAAGVARVARREIDQMRKLPGKLVSDLARASSLAQNAWVEARAQSRFDLFRPHLEHILDLTRQVAGHLGYQDHPYDALLDRFEPDMTSAQVDRLFDQLKARLVPLVEAIRPRLDRVSDAVLRQSFPRDGQFQLGNEALRAMGFDFQRGRLDTSAHPFTTSFSRNDVRITTRVDEQNLAYALYSTIHEGGHALYEQGIPEELERTPLGDIISLGLHESQSRLWENVVGRSREFWQFVLPAAQRIFPQQLGGASVEELYRAVNRVEPSFIRTEADEVTYNLHIFVRYELERDLLGGTLDVAGLPEAWNAKMEAYLGIRPPDDAKGVLQDIHWSQGSIGYFPTYTLGTVLAAQLFRQAEQEEPGLRDSIARGELVRLKEWLNRRVHAHGARYTLPEMTREITGRDLEAAPYLEYLEGKYRELYGL
ncbi:carboxypeptidase M32 [Limnochorda pilosa]|uniref:Metal-dependent carboxypeptidase n=1 Tax=Limnochorda pilosa TaxID=1555112 RepID=A0A0K2SFP9_LIMPI|nr:carboxypeptidase M32 [Limnochorda pilosa]BAS25933.1 carboxypeptidase [Limnochorda pilosa]